MPNWNSIELYTTCEVLREYGWSQHRWRTDDGFCLLEAMYEAYKRLETDYDRRQHVNDTVRKNLGGGFEGIIFWNDAYSRSFADVVELLREADGDL